MEGNYMRDAVLVELTRRWEWDAREPVVEDGSPDGQIGNAIAKGRREGMRECADMVRLLISLVGDVNQLHQGMPYKQGYDPMPVTDCSCKYETPLKFNS
jgi:hypothetical protein